jgi:Anti-sigma factor NepR
MAHDARNENGLTREVRIRPPNLEAIYRKIVSEGVPERFKELIAKLETEQAQSKDRAASDVDGLEPRGEQPRSQKRAEPE